ncbi:hypothetical protein F511_06364 [Dorcoceras hygrometricum]|uniref:Uncharacterized protein n=1 Tax=Dorcoceras hygrometricum TaxID=472368 RepID=A0A2Z7AEL5_9LAMI|nr:hypothetical protein F511_06364 [Dorcoceras hygrometricum]
MSRYPIHHNSFAVYDEMKSSTVLCPKPRRLSPVPATQKELSSSRTFRCHVSYQQEICDTKAGDELLNIIRAQGDDDANPFVTQSPPFFSGSPPSRVSNPLIQDSRFGNQKFTPIPTPSGLAPSPPSSTRVNFITPAVRIEGFDCLVRDRRHRSIPAMA